MHTALAAGYKGLTGDAAKILQGDDFLRQVVPMIMASDAYKNHGAIIIWFDESEDDGVVGDKEDDFNHTIPEIVISKRARKNMNGIPYASPLNYTHSSDLRTMEEIFHSTASSELHPNRTSLTSHWNSPHHPGKALEGFLILGRNVFGRRHSSFKLNFCVRSFNCSWRAFLTFE